MSTTEISTDNYGILKHFPKFYKQVFTCFNPYKDFKQNNDRSMNTESFLLQPILSNTSFNFKGKTLFFDEWIKSGILYVKDIFKENSKLKSTRDILDILDRLNIKNNWICEYKIIQKMLKKFEFMSDFSKIPYI